MILMTADDARAKTKESIRNDKNLLETLSQIAPYVDEATNEGDYYCSIPEEKLTHFQQNGVGGKISYKKLDEVISEDYGYDIRQIGERERREIVLEWENEKI
jgi:transcriptional regulator